MSKILIIEDNPVLSRVLCNWLERKGLQTEQTTSAVQARRMLASTDADVVLSDIRLPDGDGVEILEWMNAKQIRIPFVVMTEYAEVGSAVRAMKLGAKDYLPKPVIPEKLYAVLLAEGATISARELNLHPSEKADTFSLKDGNEERERIIKALETAAGNKVLAAGLLQISRPTLYEKMKKYGIETEK